MPSHDPIADLAPFLEAQRELDADALETPPEHLTARLIASRPFAGAESPQPPVPEHELPRDFGPYTLESILGRGSTGTVYAAHDPELDRRIAVKVLAPELATLPEARERFHREAKAAAGQQHDNLMSVLAVHQDTPYPCLTMPLLEGETLQAKLHREGPLAAEALVSIASQIATALEASHAAGIIHRDLKPSNIFLETSDQRAILMDFGLARALDAPSELTLAGSVVGTPEFLAPEQIDDKPDLTPAVDLYGLGATLYTLAKGTPPFAGSSLTGLLKKVATDPPEPLDVEGLPCWFTNLVLSLLAKSPTDRPASASDVLDHLQQQNAPKPKAPSKPASPVARTAAIIAASALLLGALAFAAWKIGQQSHSAPFSLAEALASDTEIITIPNPGVYTVEKPLQLGNRSLKVIGEQPGTILLFLPSSGPLIETAAPLTFENLVIRFDAPTLVKTSGKRIDFKHCRIDQAGGGGEQPKRPIDLPAMIEASSETTLALEHTAILSFQGLVFEGASESRLAVSDSLVIAPSLSRAHNAEAQTIDILRSTVTCVLTIVLDPSASRPTRITAEKSHIESNLALLQVPGAAPGDLRRCASWTGADNTIACARNWCSSSPNPRRPVAAGPANLPDLASWQDFWKSSTTCRSVEPILIELRLNQTGLQTSEIDLSTLDHGHATGADLATLGPR